VIIATPYRHIGDQWHNAATELDAGLEVISADSTNRRWEAEITQAFNKIQLGTKKRFVIITTHATLSNDRFMEVIRKLTIKRFLIVDEVHGAGAPVRRVGLLDDYDLRLGLSATPSRWFDDEGTSLLLQYFGGVVFELSLDLALKLVNPETGQPFLAPYRYHPHFIDLEGDELLQYRELTSRIGKMFHAARNDHDRTEALATLLNKRARIIRNAHQKINVMEMIIDNLQGRGILNRTLIYASPQQLETVRDSLIKRDVRQHKFTQAESAAPDSEGISERRRLLKGLENGDYQVLIGIRCLDEGVDVPSVDKAIIMASTGNPRQYIQRRGRILRYSKGKESADIYDIIVMPSLSSDPDVRSLEMKIIEKETKRYEEFAQLALNHNICMREITEAEIKAGLFGNVRK
jgi:superfamily II DNA or RNA helicase